jgi:hypothetical protein
MIATGAPCCPSIALYCAAVANRPNKMTTASNPSSTPMGMKNPSIPSSRPTTTNTATMPRPVPMAIGSAFLLLWLTRPATIRICFSRPAFWRSSALYLSTTGSAFLKQSIRLQAAYCFWCAEA